MGHPEPSGHQSQKILGLHCHAINKIKKNNLKTIQCIKSRNYCVIGDE